MTFDAKTESDRYTCSEDVIDRDIGEDLLVQKPLTDEVFVLNAHARVVFEEAKQSRTREEVRAAVMAKGFRSTAAMGAVDDALDAMVQGGLLLRVAAPVE